MLGTRPPLYAASPSRGALQALRHVALALCPVLPASAQAPPVPTSVAPVFGDHMVIQREQPVRVWGEAEPGSRVTVELAGHGDLAVADATGAWELALDPLPAGGPHELRITSGDDLMAFEDVLVGDVWYCAGQSNMWWPLSRCESAETAIPAADQPRIRLFDMQGAADPRLGTWDAETLAHCTPKSYYDDLAWRVATPDSAREFSAVAWFFGRDLHARLDVPIGLVHNALIGTGIESFVSREGLLGNAQLADAVTAPGLWLDNPALPAWPRTRARKNLGAWFEAPEGPMPGHPFQPSFLFEAGVRPLARFGLRGVIWYQGEANATVGDHTTPADPDRCRAGIEALISDWRRTFERPDLPFLYVQLPRFDRPWMEFREVQRQCLDIPNTSMAVTIDLGEPTEVHPGNKREVGRRLALLAAADVYGGEAHAARSPSIASLEVWNDMIAIGFEDTAGGLRTSDRRAAREFELLGADGTWHRANSAIGGDRVIVMANEVVSPRAVRHAWTPVPRANLVGGSGLPVPPFTERVDEPRPVEALASLARGARGVAEASATVDPPHATRRPNLVLIVADDLGWGDLGSYGQERIQTPHLDRMAAEGVRFTDFYAGSPVCAPSRCTLLTGQHAGHAFVRDNSESGGWGEHDPEGQLPLRPGTLTLGRVLQAAGYATACIGKWGLGGPGSTGAPTAQGFDHFFGYLCQRQAHNFYPTHLWNDDERVELEGNVWKNLTGPHYAHDLMTEDALRWIGERDDEPFFLLLTYTIPHLALQVPEDSLEPYLGAWDDPPYEGGKGYLPHPTPRAAYAGMVSRMDRDVGSLLDLLAERGLDDDTLVMFTSDNGATYDIGGADTPFFRSNADLRGAKGSVYEGGLRVPLIARWPGRVPAGEVSDAVGAFWDLMPTLLEAAGLDATAKVLDGESLLPVLLGAAPARERTLYWEFPGYGSQQALRDGDWSLVRRDLAHSDRTTTELFDLAADPAQEHDLAAEHPELVERMLARMAEEHRPSSEFPLPGVDTPAQ